MSEPVILLPGLACDARAQGREAGAGGEVCVVPQGQAARQVGPDAPTIRAREVVLRLDRAGADDLSVTAVL